MPKFETKREISQTFCKTWGSDSPAGDAVPAGALVNPTNW